MCIRDRVYVAALLFITLYALFEFQLLFYYFKKYRKLKSFKPTTVTEWPYVTIQLPLFNELYVVERLIDDICKIDYPTAVSYTHLHITDDIESVIYHINTFYGARDDRYKPNYEL